MAIFFETQVYSCVAWIQIEPRVSSGVSQYYVQMMRDYCDNGGKYLDFQYKVPTYIESFLCVIHENSETILTWDDFSLK